MNTLLTFLLIINAIYFIASNDAASLPDSKKKFTLRGRITFPGGSPILIEPNANLIVELQDTSLADAPAKLIARGTSKTIRFPIAFAIKYSSKQILDGSTYSLRATIKNQNNELLYTNDDYIRVIPTGTRRTRFIDVPVILVKKTNTGSDKNRWPELVGRDGGEAVQIIKQETGLTNVMMVKERSPVTMDYRMDRVRVFVNSKGLVTSVPSVA